jgi:pSer/pThr/pTyr-binding forkhead associated (FHA) protein
MAAKLIVTKNNQEVTQIHLERTVVTIGRKHVNDLHLDDLGVSGTHAKILTVGNDSFIEDLNSTNGTFVNDAQIQKTALRDQDTIKIGDFELRYLNTVTSVDDEMEKTVILQAGSVVMQDPENKPTAPSNASSALSTAANTSSSSLSNSQESQAKLTVVDGPSKGKYLTLSKIITRVKGPKGQNSLISKKGDGYFILNTLREDLAPSVNGKVISVGSTELHDGDIIAMGNNQLKFTLN